MGLEVLVQCESIGFWENFKMEHKLFEKSLQFCILGDLHVNGGSLLYARLEYDQI